MAETDLPTLHTSLEEGTRVYPHFMALLAKGSRIALPNREVQLAWHLHLMDQPKYYQDIKQAFGDLADPIVSTCEVYANKLLDSNAVLRECSIKRNLESRLSC